MNDSSFELLDILTILSFLLQVKTQNSLFTFKDFQEDNNRVTQDIHAHLQMRDKKIELIMNKLGVVDSEAY